jgi:hypothetical protein
MATGRNFSMSGINSRHHKYRTNSTLSDFNEISYVGRLWCPKLIPDIDKFLPVSIFKMAAYPHIKFWWYRIMLNFYRPFLCRVLAAILKMVDILKILTMQNCSSSGDLSLSTADLRNYWTEFHETWWNYRYMFLVDPKVFRFVIKGVKAIF